MAFLPMEPGFFNRVRASAPIHIRQVKSFPEAAARGAPTLGRVIAEILWVRRLKRAGTTRDGAGGEKGRPQLGQERSVEWTDTVPALSRTRSMPLPSLRVSSISCCIVGLL